MLIYVAPDAAQPHRRGARRCWNDAQAIAGASAWNGMLVVRALARDGRTLQADLRRCSQALSGRPLPRVWQC